MATPVAPETAILWRKRLGLPVGLKPGQELGSLPNQSNNQGGGGQPQPMDYIDYMMGRYPGSAEHMKYSGTMGAQLADAGVGAYSGLYSASPMANIMGYGNLLEILSNQGRSDPRMLNAQRAQIQQSTQGAQMQQQGMAARQGFQNSGVNASLQAALGNAGNARQSDLVARDASEAEARRRQDLGLFMDLIQKPSENAYALTMNQFAGDAARAQQDKAAKYGAYASLIGAIAGAFCWVADAVLDDKMAVERCRLWMRLYADPVLVDLYREYGPGLAARAKEDPSLAAQLRPLFKAMDENVMARMAEDGWFGGEA